MGFEGIFGVAIPGTGYFYLNHTNKAGKTFDKGIHLFLPALPTHYQLRPNHRGRDSALSGGGHPSTPSHCEDTEAVVVVPVAGVVVVAVR